LFDSLANFLMKIAVYAGVGVVAFVVFVAVLKLLRGFLWSLKVPKDLRGAYWRTFFYFRSAVRSKQRNFGLNLLSHLRKYPEGLPEDSQRSHPNNA
jgi:hypothetical protein